MKIFLSFLQGKPGHPIPAYGFWEYYIKQGLQEAGHQWYECTDVDWAYGLVNQDKQSFSAWKTTAWEKTVDYLKKTPVDLFLSYLYPHQVDTAAIRTIRGMGIPCVNFFCDNIRTFRRIPEEYAVFDLNWVPEHKALDLYNRRNIPCIHLPMPMWVAPEHRVAREERLPQITFIGSRDIQRLLLFEEIAALTTSLPLTVYGEGWLPAPAGSKARSERHPSYGIAARLQHQAEIIRSLGMNAYFRKLRQRNFNPSPSAQLTPFLKGKPGFDEYIGLTQESYITIGINRYPSLRFPLHRPDTYSRLRDIEAPMLGSCYLTESAEGLDEMYDLGSEIMVYKDAEDFIGQCKRLLADPALRKTLRAKGQRRALETHSIAASLGSIQAKI
jgi:hypothetical protein